jgi:hypothetical protein
MECDVLVILQRQVYSHVSSVEHVVLQTIASPASPDSVVVIYTTSTRLIRK